MLDLRLFDPKNEKELQNYEESLKNRGGDLELLGHLKALSKKRRDKIFQAESLKAEQKKRSLDVALAKKNGGSIEDVLQELGAISKRTKVLEEEAKALDEEMRTGLMNLPNGLDPDVPKGKSEESNRVEKVWGKPPKFPFAPRDHVELGEVLMGFDFDRAVKISKSRFAFVLGPFAKLERALTQYMLDKHTIEHGYTEMSPPYMVNEESMLGTGQFPKFKEDVFHLKEDAGSSGLFLIPTAEVPVTNYFRGEILPDVGQPRRFCAFSPCFRSEAGSYGRDTRGLIRQHQFHKVELVSFCKPEDSKNEHERLTSNAEAILEGLGLHYRRVALCAGDISFSAYKCYDLEVWLPSSDQYREISSCSNFGDFQARRAMIRYRDSSTQQTNYLHTLNGSGLAVGRALIAVVENYQQEDGSVLVPEVLRPYMGGLEVIKPA